MCAHEISYNPLTGKNELPPLTKEGIYPRLQLIRRNGEREMRTPYKNAATHEWWAADGKYFVVDGSYPYQGLDWWRGCPSTVRFWNQESGKLIDVVTLNPVVEGWTPQRPSIYHIDPHPRFVVNDQWVTFTTTVCGRVDVAAASTQQLIQLSR